MIWLRHLYQYQSLIKLFKYFQVVFKEIFFINKMTFILHCFYLSSLDNPPATSRRNSIYYYLNFCHQFYNGSVLSENSFDKDKSYIHRKF